MTSPWRLAARSAIRSAIASVPDGDLVKIKPKLKSKTDFKEIECTGCGGTGVIEGYPDYCLDCLGTGVLRVATDKRHQLEKL